MAEEKEKGLWGGDMMTTSRARVADLVFNHLARAILRGQLEPGEALPAERDLAERYSVSRVLVREAVHKLKELGLLRVKQGGQTIVLDPTQASDPRIMSLEIELDGATKESRAELAQKLLTHAVALLAVAHERVDEGALLELETFAASLEAAKDTAKSAIVASFWLGIARATKSALLQRETRFWLELAERGDAMRCLWKLDDGFYLRLVGELRQGGDPAAAMLTAIRPALAQ